MLIVFIVDRIEQEKKVAKEVYHEIVAILKMKIADNVSLLMKLDEESDKRKIYFNRY